MVYLGDNWPEEYRGSVFMNNIHGKRVNHDSLERHGSGYRASHRPDVIRSKDPWHVGVTIQYGPDGGVFVSDWSDIGECHSVRNTQRETGRIFKVTFGEVRKAPVDVAQLSNEELVQLHLHRNDWFVRHARRLLQERAAGGQNMKEVADQLRTMFDEQAEVPRKLRALWTLHSINATDEAFLLKQLKHSSENVRGWAIRLLCEDFQPSQAALQEMESLATEDSSQYVRLQLASMCQRIPPQNRWGIAKALLGHADDRRDANLPLMYWYAIEPLVDEDFERFVSLGRSSKISLVREHVARRVASHEKSAEDWMRFCRRWKAMTRISCLVARHVEGLEGRRSVPMPKAWQRVYAKIQESPYEDVRFAAIDLALVFDDQRALESLSNLARDEEKGAGVRQRALRALISKRADGTGAILMSLVDHPELQGEAIRGLAEFNEANTATELLKRFPKWSGSVRQDALQTLASRRDWAGALMDAIESQVVDRKELTAFTTRQLISLGDAKLVERVNKVWGELRTTPADKAKLIADYRKRLAPLYRKQFNREAGQKLFEKNCATCHQLFGSGAKIGPDLSGSQRFNLDYMLENLIDPSAAVSKDFQMEVLLTDTGRVITGMVVDSNDQSLTIQTASESWWFPWVKWKRGRYRRSR